MLEVAEYSRIVNRKLTLILVSGLAAKAAPAPRAPAKASESRGKNSGRGSFNGYKKFHKGASRKRGSGGGVEKGRTNEKNTSSENMGGKRKSYNKTFGGGGGGGIGMMPT